MKQIDSWSGMGSSVVYERLELWAKGGVPDFVTVGEP